MNRTFILTLVLILFGSLTLLHGQCGEGEYQEFDITVDGLERKYTVYTPPGHDGTEAWPLVFVFHGFWTPVTTQIAISELCTVADTGRFLVVYPLGLPVENLILPPAIQSGWSVPGFFGAAHEDVTFVNEMIDDIYSNPEFAVDLNRVHATGWSNGGLFSFYLAGELSGRIASVASVANPLPYSLVNADCFPSRPMSILYFEGTDDHWYTMPQVAANFASIEETAAFWAANNHCDGTPEIFGVPDFDPTDNSTVTFLKYQNCYKDYEVHAYKIDGGGHSWPGGWLPGGWGFLGAINNDISASSLIWNFFKNHPLPSVPINNLVCDAIELTVDDTLQTEFTNVDATVSCGEQGIVPTEFNCQLSWCESGQNTADNSVWFKFAPPTNEQVKIDICADFNTQIALYSASDCSDFTSFMLIAANDDNLSVGCTGDYTSSLLLEDLTPDSTYYLMVDGHEGAWGTFDIHVKSLISSIKEELARGPMVSVYPNPNNGQFYIRFEGLEGSGQLQIINAIGAIVHEQVIVNQSQGTIVLDLQQLPNGIYIMKLGNEDQLSTRKIIVE